MWKIGTALCLNCFALAKPCKKDIQVLRFWQRVKEKNPRVRFLSICVWDRLIQVVHMGFFQEPKSPLLWRVLRTGRCNALGTFGLPCRAHPGAVPFPPQRTYTVSRCMRSPKRRQPAEASNTRPLMSMSDVACEGSHMRYFGGLVSCPPYNLPLLRVWSQRSTARSLV